MKKLRIICFLAALSLVLVGCSKTKEEGSKFYTDEIAKPEAQKVQTAYTDKEVGFQLEQPTEGEEVALISTTLGDIYIRFFPEAAPKAVENFKGLIKKGSYNGIIFHRVINNFMIQGGDYQYQNGTGGQSIWGSSFEDEFDSKLFNLRGSLSMANAGVNTNGSQFFINQATAETFDNSSLNYEKKYKQFEAAYNNYKAQNPEIINSYPTLSSFIKANGGISPLDYTIPQEVLELYKNNGGNINLDGAFRESGGHTVFGQVYSGMDVVDKIAAVETDNNDKPKTDIKIVSAKIIKYSK